MALLTRSSARLCPQLVARQQVRRLASHADAGQRVAVIGGGLTGLTAAYFLAKELPATARITLYESSDRLGGWIRTDKVPVDVNGVKGIVNFERGPRTLTSLRGNYWRYDDLVLYELRSENQMLDLGLKLVYPKDLPRFVYYPDHLVKMPPAASIFDCLSEDLFRECIWGALATAFAYLTGSKRGNVPKDDISVGMWLRYITKSDAMGNNLASAMLHGIYGGDIERLSARSVLDRMYYNFHMPAAEKGTRHMPMHEQMLMEYMSKDKLICAEANKPKGSLIHFGQYGMESLPKALEHALAGQSNVTIQREAPVDDLSYLKNHNKVQVTAKGKTHIYENVISTTSSKALVASTGDRLSALESIESVSIMTVNLWYPIENMKPRGFGYLIPRSVPAEQNPEHALGVFFDSDVIAERGPDEPAGTKLFVLMGGHYYDGRNPPSEEEAVEQAKAVLERHLGIPRHTPCHAMARLARDCIPQPITGHEFRLRAADSQLLSEFEGRLTVASGSYGRIGVMGALRNGHAAAYSILRHHKYSGLDDFIREPIIATVPAADIPCRQPQNKA
ncbi:hypothetical protein PWT90_02096 [Aphanocladium album]|nr:hypothetical protein PWT90_02096 [Aphanocladium album]